MPAQPRWLSVVCALACGLAFAPSSTAEMVRFHYVPAGPAGAVTQVAAGPDGALGERRLGLGLAPEAYPYVVQPNQMVTFRHPFTGCNVTVPLRLPEGTPRLEQRTDRVIYNYGSYVVEARFFQDGSVDTVYNSGFLRALRFD